MGITYGTSTLFQATKGIVQDGLVLNLDAAVKESYNSGTSWKSLIGNGIATLQNDVFFDRENGGSFVFDGTDDHMTTNFLPPTGSNERTFFFSLYKEVGVSVDGHVLEYGPNADLERYTIRVNSNTLRTEYQSAYNTTSRSFSNGWNICCVSLRGSTNGDHRYFLNGVFQSTAGSSTLNTGSSVNLNIGRSPVFGRHIIGKIGFVYIYDRGLTDEEITQNYNAIKARFGL